MKLSHLMAAATAALVTLSSIAVAQSKPDSAKPRAAAHDTAFAAMQERGKHAMGVDQYTSTHKFDVYPDGGRIELVSDDSRDTADVAQIRRHLREIKSAFERGDFSTPAFVHMRDVPGTKVMAAQRSLITYEVHDIPGGGELHMRTKDPAALKAIYDFMNFQRMDHHAGGHGG
jgi:hypothetical protein